MRLNSLFLKTSVFRAAIIILTYNSVKETKGRMKICTYGFRFSTKIYDVISIGPYANKVAQEISNVCSSAPEILGVEEENFSV